jgi:hypothetical protein
MSSGEMSTAHPIVRYSTRRDVTYRYCIELVGAGRGVVVKDSRRKSIHVMYLLGFGALGYGVQHFLIPGKLTTVAVVAAWIFVVMEAYAKPFLKKYRPIAARNEDKKVFSGLL